MFVLDGSGLLGQWFMLNVFMWCSLLVVGVFVLNDGES